MKPKLMSILNALLIIILCLLAPGSIIAQQYTITDLGPGIAMDINNRGQVAGNFQPDPPSSEMGFYWDSVRGRENIDLDGHGGFQTIH
jgi:hypothetical protein